MPAGPWHSRAVPRKLLAGEAGHPGMSSQCSVCGGSRDIGCKASAPSMSSNSCAAPVAAPTAGGAATPTFASR
eukprot:700681-Amphidinium_carterae.2